MEKMGQHTIPQHSIRYSIWLHLFPGILVLIGIFTFSQSMFYNALGINPALGPVFGFIMAILLILCPIEFGWLLFEGKKHNGKWTLKGVINYTEKSPNWQYFVVVPLLIGYTLLMFVIIAPSIQPIIVDTFFAWWPEEYNFQNVFQDPAPLSGYRAAKMLAVLFLIVNGILAPLVEELYFRGYLLPRLEHTRNWAPLINAVLFSIYHFFSPWENPVRILGLLPIVYWVWWKKDIKFSIFQHTISNSIGGIILMMVVFS